MSIGIPILLRPKSLILAPFYTILIMQNRPKIAEIRPHIVAGGLSKAHLEMSDSGSLKKKDF